jgi:subtilisin family serine protease
VEWLMTEMNQKKMFRGRALGIAFGIMIVAFMLVGCAAAAPPAGIETYHGREVAANAVLVKFQAAMPDDVRIGEDLDETELVGTAGVMRLHSRSRNTAALINSLSGRPDVAYVEPDYIVHAVETIPDDPRYGELWGLTKISAPLAWDSRTGSTANVAAVIDTGIDYTHPDLAANVWSAPYAYTVTIGGQSITCPAGSHGFNAITHTCNPMDDNSHGTHVSGTIGAVGDNGIGVTGVNWKTKIIGAKFLNKRGSGSLSDAIEAIDFVIQTRNTFGDDANVRVLSNSWAGGDFSQSLLDEINNANDYGMLFVAAAGNEGMNNDILPSFPSSYEAANVVAVAATDSTDSLAYFSNYGLKTVDLAAPGVSILSTVRGGGYATYSGTSMATPHVSGAALLVLSACDLDTVGLKDNILKNVDPVSSLAGKTNTSGRLNVYKAISACGLPPSPDFSLSASPTTLSIVQGESGTSTVTVSDLNGFTGTVNLEVSVTPSGPFASLSPETVTNSGTSTLTVNTGTAPAGTYLLTITGTSGSLTHTTEVTVTITTPASSDFSLSATPTSRTITAGSTTTYTVFINRISGFTGPVDLSVSGLPAGVNGVFYPESADGASSILTITTFPTTKTKTYPLTITGESGSLIHTTTVSLSVRRAK